MPHFAEFSWLPDTTPMSLPVRILTALAITAVGGLGAGVLVQLLTRSITRASAPRPALNLVRIAGAAAAGLAAILWLFGTGSGFGTGGKGSGEGEGGKGNQSLYSAEQNEGKKDRIEPKKAGTGTPAAKDILRIDVLGNTTVRQLADSKAVEENRRFRIPDEGMAKLFTIDEIVELIAQRARVGRLPEEVHVISHRTETKPQDVRPALARLQQLAHELGKDATLDTGWIKPKEN